MEGFEVPRVDACHVQPVRDFAQARKGMSERQFLLSQIPWLTCVSEWMLCAGSKEASAMFKQQRAVVSISKAPEYFSPSQLRNA